MFLGFGEIMIRIATRGHQRFRQGFPGTVEVSFGGGEANVCVSLAQFGQPVRFLTAVPRHAIAESLLAVLRSYGIDVSQVVFSKGRLGIYFLEPGATQRSSVVLYDREGSCISLAGPEAYNFDAALEGVRWVHVTGITPALSEKAYLATRRLVQQAAERGVPVSCDLNFRKKLWTWRAGTPSRDLARECMSGILAHVTLVVANEEDLQDVLDIDVGGTAVERGVLCVEAYPEAARQVVRRFPNVRRVAVTLRQSLSADYNHWGGMLYEAASDRAYFAPTGVDGTYRPYEIRDIVDRVGAGDAFAAGLLHAFQNERLQAPETALRFAVAASCLKHSVPGDFNCVTEEEVRTLMEGGGSGRVRR